MVNYHTFCIMYVEQFVSVMNKMSTNYRLDNKYDVIIQPIQ